MRIGVMGGTFDPIHHGHLRAAELAREALDLSSVLFVPTGRPPHRPPPFCSDLDRYAMVCLAIQGHPRFQALDIELLRETPCYTVETVASLAARHPGAKLNLIVGDDAFQEMRTWKDLDRLVGLCRVAVVDRPETDPGSQGLMIDDSSWAVRVPGPSLPISSTMIRKLLKEGRSARYLIPDSVAEHIARQGLYR